MIYFKSTALFLAAATGDIIVAIFLIATIYCCLVFDANTVSKSNLTQTQRTAAAIAIIF